MRYKIYIAGQDGMVGSAVYKLLKKEHQIIECSRKSLDLTSQSEVSKWFKKHKPQIMDTKNVMSNVAKIAWVKYMVSY